MDKLRQTLKKIKFFVTNKPWQYLKSMKEIFSLQFFAGIPWQIKKYSKWAGG